MKRLFKNFFRRIRSPVDVVRQAYRAIRGQKKESGPFPGSASYWEKRYSAGGDSGVGSYGSFAEFKADVLNKFVAAHKVRTVIEFGCGDGNQLRLSDYPMYTGFDVSNTAILKCKELYRLDKSKSFRLMDEYRQDKADLTLSLDVIYHLVEDGIFENYMRLLFGASERYVIIYSSDCEDNSGYDGSHIRHRKFTKWVGEKLEHWNLVERVPNRYPYNGNYRTGSFADFFVYERH